MKEFKIKETYTRDEVGEIIDMVIVDTLHSLNPHLKHMLAEIKAKHSKKETAQIGNFALGLILGLALYHFVFLN